MTITVISKRVPADLPEGTLIVYVGRPSPLGNPFHTPRDGTREEVIAKFSEWLKAEVEKPDSPARAELIRIFRLAKHHDIALQCWCAPKACHGDVIKAFLDVFLEE